MPEKEDPSDNLRCTRTDGKQWRCKKQVSDGKKYCEDHFNRLQSPKKKPDKVPEEVNKNKNKEKTKQRKPKISENREIREKKKGKQLVEVKTEKKRSASEALDETLRKLKLKKGDIQLELIREYLIRKVEKKRENELEERAKGKNNIIKELPNGRMSITPAEPSKEFDYVSPYNVKVGMNCKTIQARSFRSKNVEPMPVCTMQNIPHIRQTAKAIKDKRKCHWCRKSTYRVLIRCKSCRKQYFCEDCIGERSLIKEELRTACPVCRKTCRCRACSTLKPKDIEKKEPYEDKEKAQKSKRLCYLLKMLFPVLEKMNWDQSVELEVEAEIKGATPSEIPQVKSGGKNFKCCYCDTSVIDFHRGCTSCSYKLCLSCCHEFRQGKLSGGIEENKVMYPNRKRACTFDNKIPSKRQQNSSSKQDSKSVAAQTLLENWKVDKDGRISCPPKFCGGCGCNNILDLRCLFSFGWIKELKASVEDIFRRYDFPEIPDNGSCCSVCRKTDLIVNGTRQLLETARRDMPDDNFLYCPTIEDLNTENLEHFQKHWANGQPVIVRNVIQIVTNMSWNPVTLFCDYLGKSHANKRDKETRKPINCLDWFEVEVSDNQILIGSLESQTKAFLHRETMKIRGWFFPKLFQEHFPAHYDQIMHSIPLKEYMHPESAFFNLAARLPKDVPKPDLGPSVHIAYGEPEEFMQGHFVTRLSYDSCDMVNILAYAANVPISRKDLDTVKALLNKCKDQDHRESMNKDSDQPLATDERVLGLNIGGTKKVRRKSSHRSEITKEAVSQHGVLEDVNLPNAIAKASRCSGDSYVGDAQTIRPQNTSDANKQVPLSDSKRADLCGAQWDIFRRQDVPKLLEYIRRHWNESISVYNSPMHVVHPILDQSFYFDAFQKMRLKQEFNIEPWTFEQNTGEAVIIPAGCPYQVKQLKSCVSVSLKFISPENSRDCIRVDDEIRLLPVDHKAKEKFQEVQKMTLHNISASVEEITNLKRREAASQPKRKNQIH